MLIHSNAHELDKKGEISLMFKRFTAILPRLPKFLKKTTLQDLKAADLNYLSNLQGLAESLSKVMRD